MVNPSIKKKPTIASQSLLRQQSLSFNNHSQQPRSSGAGPSRGSAPLRQASLHQMAGVVKYREEVQNVEGVANTLYLGEEDLRRLRSTIEENEADRETLLRVLRRLSAVPITRECLEETCIGVAVGRLRRHADAAVSDLAERIVRVWKGQLSEHKKQKRAHR